MTQPSWGLSQGPNAFQNAFSQSFQMGRQIKQSQQQEEKRNALAAYVLDPNEANTAAVAPHAPQLVMQQRQQQAAADAQAKKDNRAGMADVAKLFEGVTAENYGQRVSIAQQMGLDVTGIPQQFDPAWVSQQQQTFKFFSTDEGQKVLSTGGKIALDSGLQQGTPEFQAFVKDYATAQLAKPYTGSQGETRLYQPQLGGQQPSPQAQPTTQGQPQILERAKATQTITAQEADRISKSLGPNGQAAFDKWKSDNGIRVISRTGTAPDGRKVTQFEDGTIVYAD